ALTFQNHTDCPLTDFRGKTSIFSHPVYLFLRKFSLQDSRGGSTSLKTSIKTITYLSDTGCLEIQGASLVIYTTNAIESLNSVIRHAIKKRKVFPTDDSVKKVVWLAIQAASQKWTMPLRDWRMAMSRFIIEFGDRLDGHF
ncbi:transposase, partial [Escherichia coli]|nr:transposase [Escherichia coli]